MHFGLVIYGDLEQQTGGYLYDRKLVGHLQSQGDQVEIISLPKRSYSMLLLDNFSRHLKKSLLGLRVDILVQDELNHPSLFLLNKILRKRVNYPLVAIVHHLRKSEDHPRWLKPLYRSIERSYLQTLDGFIYNSHATQNSVEKLFPLPEGDQPPCIVAYPGGDQWSPQISAGEIASRCHQKGPLRLFFAGNLIPRKGLHVLIETLEQLGRADFHLDVAGNPEADPAYSRAARRLVEAKGLTATVTFLGSLSGQDFVSHLRTSHVTVIPSIYEGFGIVYLEGMGFGLPAIGSTAGGATEIIQPGVNGFLITPGDSTTLARYLHELADNRQRLFEMSLAAYHQYRQQPTWEHSMGSVRQFLTSASFPAQRPSSKTLI